MMLVHESGHMLAAKLTGGSVQKLVFHPLALSRTDVAPNPHPLAVAWSGPTFGTIAPLLLWLALRAAGIRSYLAQIYAGFCLIANGAYIAFGSLGHVGDTYDLLLNDAPLWSLWLFGLLSLSAGFLLWHRLGPHFGLRTRAAPIDVWLSVGLSVALILVGLLIDGR